MHVFLRSNVDRFAIRAVAAPWSEKRSIRLFGPSDLNIRDQISYPVLYPPAEHDFGRDMEKDRAPRPTTSRTPSEADSIEKYLGQLDSQTSTRSLYSLPGLKQGPIRSSTPARSSYSVFPHRNSIDLKEIEHSTSSPNVQKVGDMPLPPAPLFAQSHKRAVSTQSTGSATVQIGLSLSYMGHALDPIEQSSPTEVHVDRKDVASLSPLLASSPTSATRTLSQAQVQVPKTVFVAPQQIYMPPQQTIKPKQIDIPPTQKRPATTILMIQTDKPQPPNVPAPTTQINVPHPTKSPRTPTQKPVPEWRPPIWKPKTPTVTTTTALRTNPSLPTNAVPLVSQSSASS